jgi:hypothetical protein
MSKPNWCCNMCGDHFSRRFSANRHMRLRHRGAGMAIPFTHYIAGIRSGIYPAFPRPTFSKSNSLQDIFYEEYQREYARKLVRGPSSNRTKSEFRIPSFLPYFPTGLPSFPSTTQLDITQISNQIPRLNSDDVFGLVEELCHEFAEFSRRSRFILIGVVLDKFARIMLRVRQVISNPNRMRLY